MSWILSGAFVFLALYGIVLLWLAVGYVRTGLFSLKQQFPHMPVTIIICARNEEKTIAGCLQSILTQNYTLSNVQVILIDDASSDQTLQKAGDLLNKAGIDYKIISNTLQKGKKQSITDAMQFAVNNLIILRDADTFTVSPDYLRCISDFYQTSSPDLIIAPLAIAGNSGILWALQAIENNVLLVAACGGVFYNRAFLCNGANLIFTRQTFERTNGYTSHLHIASGDDIFFMEEVKKLKDSKIKYLKSGDALVYTYPQSTLKQLIFQRIRWASKFKINKNKLNLALALLSLAVNFIWPFCLVYSVVPEYRTGCLSFVVLKLFIDILLLFLASNFIKNKHVLWFSFPVGFIYPVYAVIIGLASLFVKPKWK